MDRGLGDNESRASTNGCNLPTMDLVQSTTGLGRATTGLRWATAGRVRATTGRRSDTYVCTGTHLYVCAIHFFLSTVDLGLTRRLYLSYPIPTSKFKKIW